MCGRQLAPESGKTFNKLDWVHPPPSLSISFSLSAVPSSPPESPQCDVLGSTSIYITWSPPDIDGQNGKIKGYKVFYISVDELYGKSAVPSPSLPSFPLFFCYPVCLVPNCLARKSL